MGGIAIRLSVLLAAPAATFAAAPAITPDAAALGRALSEPRLIGCDDLVCRHRLGRDYAIRALNCRELTGDTLACTYRRAPTRNPPAIVSPPELADVPADPPRWVAAETTLKLVGTGWIVLDDTAG